MFVYPTQDQYVPAGVFYGGNTWRTKFANGTVVDGGPFKGALVANALAEICCILAWVIVFTTPFFLFWNKLGLMRISADVEEAGLDVSSHGGTAYPEQNYAYDAEKKMVKIIATQ
jgi:ammonia channel protein AmtB